MVGNQESFRERIAMRIAGMHDELIAYAGTQQRFTRRSKLSAFAVEHALRFIYPTDFNQSWPSSLLRC